MLAGKLLLPSIVFLNKICVTIMIFTAFSRLIHYMRRSVRLYAFIQNTFPIQKQDIFYKKRVLRNFAKFRRKHPVPEACNFVKKETLSQVFSWAFCEIYKNTFLQHTSRRLSYSLADTKLAVAHFQLTPEKHQQPEGFLMFSGGTEKQHRAAMD